MDVLTALGQLAGMLPLELDMFAPFLHSRVHGKVITNDTVYSNEQRGLI